MRRDARCWSRLWLGALLCAFAAPAAGPAQTRTAVVSRCQTCHGELEFLRQRTASLESARALHVDEEELLRSAHGRLPCAQCHTGFGAFPHAANTSTASCQQCHDQQANAWQKGRHASTEGREPVTCTQCHGVHAAASVAQLRAPGGVHDMNALCSNCHSEHRLTGGPHADSIACSSCHGAHDIQPMRVVGSSLSFEKQSETCGACHQVEAASWRVDVHGSAVLSAGPGTSAGAGTEEKITPPACTTCHGGHGLSVAPDSTLARAGQERCASCHEKYAETFGDSYHGQAARLEDGVAATCSSCHSAHSIYPAKDARSRVASANLIATCGSCHPGANAGFVRFQPHANPHDAAKNPLLFWVYKFMSLLLVGVLSVFGLHTALWVLRVFIDRTRTARAGGEA